LIEKGTKQDKEAFIHFINYVFGMNGADQSFPKLLPKLYGPQTSPAEYNYLIREQGQIRAAVGAFPPYYNQWNFCQCKGNRECGSTS